MLGLFGAVAIVLNTATDESVQATEEKLVKIAAIGDSNTYGAGVEFDNREKNSYPGQLQSSLGDRYRVFNYGIGGTTLINDIDQAYTKTEYYTESQKLNPDIVLIMLGTNDSTASRWNPTKYERDLTTFVNTYKQLASFPEVYLLTVPFAYIPGSSAAPGEINGDIITNNAVPIIRRVAQHTNTSLIDVYTATKNQSHLFPDRVHANADGYGIIADQVYMAIK